MSFEAGCPITDYGAEAPRNRFGSESLREKKSDMNGHSQVMTLKLTAEYKSESTGAIECGPYVWGRTAAGGSEPALRTSAGVG
jgi:hypothetical protein